MLLWYMQSYLIKVKKLLQVSLLKRSLNAQYRADISHNAIQFSSQDWQPVDVQESDKQSSFRLDASVGSQPDHMP